jgi:hypothetical protein
MACDLIMKTKPIQLWTSGICLSLLLVNATLNAEVGVGAKPVQGAEMLFDGSREMLDDKWTYWEGPRFASSLPIKWKIVDDPVDEGTAVMTDDPAAAGVRMVLRTLSQSKKFETSAFTSNSSFQTKAETVVFIYKTGTRSRF